METITIVSKGGKVVKTSKHLLGIFKEAKSVYQEKKAEIRAELHAQKVEKAVRKGTEQLQLPAQVDGSGSVASSKKHGHRERERGFVDDSQSLASSHRSHRTRRTRHDSEETVRVERRPKIALTADALESLASGSAAPSSYAGSRTATSQSSRSHHPRNPPSYYTESHVSRPNTTITRRHTDYPPDYENLYDEPQRPRCVVKPRSIFEPDDHEHEQTRQPLQSQLQRSQTSPQLGHNDGIDPHLAYGNLPPNHIPPLPSDLGPLQREQELQTLMTKFDHLMVEAQCVHHTATTIMTSLQKNPEAMAAVALTLAEISNVVAKMSPAILTSLKAGSPALFALLCSPQFLIAGGVVAGVTVVMFGGYKIIKKIQKDIGERNEAKKIAEAEAAIPEEAIPFDPENYDDTFDDSVIQSWRRGIADVESSAVEEEYITPKADKLRKERIKERKREERQMMVEPSLSAQSSRSDMSQSTVRRKPLPAYLDDSHTVVTESARSERPSRTRRTSKTEKTERSHTSSRVSDATTIRPDKKEKKPSALRMMFKGSSSVSTKGKEVAIRA